MRRALPLFVLVSFPFAFAACGDTAGLSEDFDLVPAEGSNQTAVVGEELGQPLRVRLIHDRGITVSGVEVAFDVVIGGGTLVTAGGEPARSATVTTDEDGFAQAVWTLGTTAGEQRVVASVVSSAGQAFRLGFSATALPGPPIPMTLTADVGILTVIGAPLALGILLRDQFNNRISGATVDWQITEGSGDLGVASSTTDEEGSASTDLTPSLLGPLQVTARVGGEVVGERELFIVESVAQDPAGDTDSPPTGRVAPDLLALGASVDDGSLRVHLEFAQEVALDGTGAPNEVLGALDLDADQDPATGVGGFAEHFDSGISIGDEYLVAMTANASGDYDVFRHVGPGEFDVELAGTITPNFTGRLVELALPLGLIGNPQGPLNMAVLVGTPEGPGSSARMSHPLLKGGEIIAVIDIGPGTAPLTVDVGAGAHSNQ